LSSLRESKDNGRSIRRLSPLLFYITTVSIVGVALLLWSLSRLPLALPGVLLFVGLALLAELTTSESLETKLAFSISSAVSFAVLLLWGALPAALVAMLSGFVSTAVSDFTRRRHDLPTGNTPFVQKAAFNASTLGLANVLGGGVYVLSGGQIGQVALLANLLPILLAAGAIELANEAIMVGVVALQMKRPPLKIWRQNISWAVPITVLTMLVGGSGLALGYQVLGVLGLGVFFLPLALTIYAFRLYVSRTKAQMAQLEQTIAELQRAQEEIHRQAAHLEALNAVIAAASAAPDLTRLLEVALDHVLQALQLDVGAIWAADQLVVKGISVEVGGEIEEAVVMAGLDVHDAFTVGDWQRVSSGHVLSALSPTMVRSGILASITVPILGEKENIGGLCVGAPMLRSWPAEEVALIEAVGRQLGAAAERLRLLREVRQHAGNLEVAIAQLQELDRLKSEFMQNASHELRTPLALIRGYMELMRDGEFGHLPPIQQEALEVIMRQAQVLGALVEDITLSLAAKARSFNKEPLPMDDLVLAGADDFRVAVERAELSLTAQVQAHLPMVLGEPFYLRRVLDNLLSNAIKFTPEGGKITLKLWQKDDCVLLQVCDTGIGIPPVEQGHIFERFYQVDGSARRKYGGMGLGLALVKEIVEAHGGTVGVESKMGEGSTFTVSLPALVDPVPSEPYLSPKSPAL
jgi:signal transduction histidine kinase